MKKREKCDQCEALMINGVYCHEHGCPNKWKDSARYCAWCGTMFFPNSEHDHFCCIECAENYRE